MRTLIFGSNGQLGRDLTLIFKEQGETLGYDLPEVDITDEVALHSHITEFAPNVVINAAAYTNVDQAEDDLENAFRVNEIGARNLAEIAAARKIPVVFYSTDYVFNGSSKRPYTPEDTPEPLGVYGKSKYAGEVATQFNNPFHFILRTAWLYGPGGNNFVEKIIRAAESRPTLRVVDDEIGSPTHTFDLAQATLDFVRTKAYGTYHVVNSGQCSRYEFAKAILSEAGISTPIEPCKATEFPTIAPRPVFSVLDNSTTNMVIQKPMQSWQQALHHYMQRRNNN